MKHSWATYAEEPLDGELKQGWGPVPAASPPAPSPDGSGDDASGGSGMRGPKRAPASPFSRAE